MQKFSTAIIGGGASGIVAAISAKRSGKSVLICEKMPSLGKKILASGNGRCNLLNEILDQKFYNQNAWQLVSSVFSKFGRDKILNFFAELGLVTYSDGGRIFPVTNQSSSVLKILEMELKRLSIPVEFNFEVNKISQSGQGLFLIRSKSGKTISCDTVILCCGGKTYPALGSDGNAYNIAGSLGHSIVKPVPVAVPLLVKSAFCHKLQGQRVIARIKCLVDGTVNRESEGDILFTKYGLSGTAAIDISESVSIAINRDGKKETELSIDLVPFLDKEGLEKTLTTRSRDRLSPEESLVGILPNKVASALKDVIGSSDPITMASRLKDLRLKANGTRGWNEADFTAGGIDIREVDADNLESRLVKGVYFAGEILDVNGKRGGYNLAWAWASGYVAGITKKHEGS